MKIKIKTIEAVRELPISAVLENQGVKLKRVGREFIAKCPWHNDTNPSLTINDDKNLCFCFVCKGGSDSVAFVQQKFGLSFTESIERIANGFKIEVERENEDPQLAARLRARYLSALNQLNKQQENFRTALKDPRAERIRQILLDRNIQPATAKHFGIGYAVDGFFAERITVPICNHKGQIVGFTGRSTKAEQLPKYKNSSTSELFDKSKLVFNEYHALEAIREADSVIFVEGHFDVMSLWQHGIKNVVAMQGTSAPDIEIINRLARRTSRFIVCYDNDNGGKKAVEQFIKIAGPVACQGRITISIAELPEGMDPDECLRSTDHDFYQVINSALPWLDWQIDSWLANLDRNDTAFVAKAEQAILKLIESIQSPALRQYYVDKATQVLMPENAGAARLAGEWMSNLCKVSFTKQWQKPSPHQTRLSTEKRLIRLYIHAPELRDYCRPLMDKIQTPSLKWLYSRIFEAENFGMYIDPANLMAVLSVAEPHYINQLRPIVMPTINVDKSPGVLRHIEDIMCLQTFATHEES